jgi:hypothetical protein
MSFFVQFGLLIEIVFVTLNLVLNLVQDGFRVSKAILRDAEPILNRVQQKFSMR